jgi:Bacterial type II secretion system protein G./Uncharacterized protein conserved in bacteria (DUF2059).
MRKLLLVLCCLALPAFAAEDERAVKEKLIGDIEKLIDIRPLVQMQLQFMTVRAGQDEENSKIMQRVIDRIDSVKLAEEWYGGYLRDNFSNDELRQMADFYRTKAGQKSAVMMVGFGRNTFVTSSPYLGELIRAALEEVEKEKTTAQPEMATLRDLRTIATCLEARATDTNEYPTVLTVEELKPLLEPVYVRRLPLVDAWGTPYAYVSDGRSYRVVSAGADRRFEPASRHLDPSEAPPRPMDDLDADIIFQDGNFQQFPRKAMPAPASEPH